MYLHRVSILTVVSFNEAELPSWRVLKLEAVVDLYFSQTEVLLFRLGNHRVTSQ